MIRLRIPASRLADFMEPTAISAIAAAMTARAPECPVERVECDLLDTCPRCRSAAGGCAETA